MSNSDRPVTENPSDPSKRGRDDRVQAVRYAGVMSGGLLLSRVLGIVRDILLAFYLGTGHVADAWSVANRLPFYLVYFLSEGSLTPAFVPVINEYLERRDRKEVRRLASAAASAIGLLVLVISVVGFFAAPLIVHVVCPGFAEVDGKIELTAHLMKWTFGFLFLFAIAGVFMALLQSVGYFVTSAIAPVVFNVMYIFALMFICPLFGMPLENWVNGLLVGLFLAGILQILMQIHPLKKRGLLPAPTVHVNHPGARRMGLLVVPTLLGVGVSELTIIANTMLASFLNEGAMAAVEYASRISAVPHMVLAGALSTAMLPLFSRQSARGDDEEFAKTLSLALRAVMFTMVPLTILTFLLSTELVTLLLERGAFSSSSTALTAVSLKFQAPLLLGAAMLRMLMVAFFSRQDTRTPVKIAVIALVFNAALGLALLKPMGIAGLSLAIGLTPCLGSVLLLWVLYRRQERFPMVGWSRTMTAVALGSVGLVLAVTFSGAALSTATESMGSLAQKLIRLSVPAILGLASYTVVAWAMRVSELSFVYRMIRRRSAS